MSADVQPCIIYKRLRPSAKPASMLAARRTFRLAEQLAEQDNYTVCGLYGDSEYARPFSGASEIRPAFHAALDYAVGIAGKLGVCTFVIGNAAPIGDGDPFLPASMRQNQHGKIRVRVANFHLQPNTKWTSLRSAWCSLKAHQQAVCETLRQHGPIAIDCFRKGVDVIVRRDPKRRLASLYLTNPTRRPIVIKWMQHVRALDQPASQICSSEWQSLMIPMGSAAYLDSVFQRDLPRVRQLRFKREVGEHKLIGSVHLTQDDMLRDQMPVVWEMRH